MARFLRVAGRIAACVVICTAFSTFDSLSAQEQSVITGPQVIQGPSQEAIPGPGAANAEVHPAPPISTHAGPRARRMLACHGQVNLVMVTKNPADCCLYEIPLCVPACCEGQPAVREGRGIFGRGIVEYCWPCGFTAKVKFRPVHCDVKIEYTCN